MDILGPHGTTTDSIVDRGYMQQFTPRIAAPKTNAWYFSSVTGGINTKALTAGDLYCMPVVLPYDSVTLQALGLDVTTAGSAGSVARMGIFADDGTGYPGALVAGSEVSGIVTTATGFKSGTLAAPLTIRGGFYWFGLVAQTAGFTSRSYGGNLEAMRVPMMNSGTTTLSSGTTQVQSYRQTGVTGALPSTFTTTILPDSAGLRTLFRT
jgi:hypothetical protein